MKYSVIIPVYNVEDKLERCIRSLLVQNYSDYEIILVNDGSVDSSPVICRQYADDYKNIVFVDKENGGASSARNAGIDVAQGDFILFVDSDDYVEENFFSTMEGKAIREGLTVFTYRQLTHKGEFIRNPGEFPENMSLFDKCRKLILNRTINSPCAKILDRELIEKHSLRFDEKMPVAEDFIFGISYLMQCQDVQIYNEPIYCYDNTNDSSLVRKRKTGLLEIYYYVFDTAISIVNDNDFSKEQKLELTKIIDKLHTDSFITCIMEELKDASLTTSQIKKEIKKLCSAFYKRYYETYGYCNLIHFAVRFCIKHKLVNLLYYSSKAYAIYRG